MSALPLYEGDIEESRSGSPRQLAPAPAREAGPARTPLALIRSAPRARRRLPFIIFCIVLSVASIGTVLVLNVTVSRNQYELVKLRSQQQAVAQENGALMEQRNNREAPQNLAASAKEQSMVAGGQPGVVDLNKGKVTAAAEAATATDAQGKTETDSLNVATPLTPEQRAASVAKKQDEARRAQEAATARANGETPDSSASTTEGAATSGTGSTTSGTGSAGTGTGAATNVSGTGGTSATSGSSSSASTQAGTSGSGETFTKKQLNGGTIPAPSSN